MRHCIFFLGFSKKQLIFIYLVEFCILRTSNISIQLEIMNYAFEKFG